MSDDKTELTIEVGPDGRTIVDFFQPSTGHHPLAHPLELGEGTYSFQVPVDLAPQGEVSATLEGEEILIKPTGR